MLARLGTTLALTLLAGCGGDNGRDAEVVIDASVIDASFDASWRDGGPGIFDEEGALCVDGLDNDDDGATDCEEGRCSALPVCCVASSAPRCCAESSTPISLALDGCIADGPAAACLDDASMQLFGGELPVIEDGDLVPQGGLGHGGVALGAPLDPRALNVAMEASIEVPPSAERCTECMDAAGLALLAELPAPGERALIAFGVLVVGSRDEIIVIAGDETVARRTLGEDLVPAGGTLSLSLETNVEGLGIVRLGGTELARVEDLSLPALTWLTVLGRTSNRAGLDAVRVSSASASTQSCDVPSALGRRSAPVLPWSGSTWAPLEVRRPSVVAWEDEGTSRALMAFAHDGEIYLAGRTGFGEFRNAMFDPGAPALERPSSLVAMRDPWLVIDAQRFVLYFVGVSAGGQSSIWRTRGGPDFSQDLGSAAQVLDPTSLGLGLIDGPTVLVGEGTWTMVVRERIGDQTRLVRLRSDDAGASWTLRGGSLASATVHGPRGGDLFAFDRDEVSAPALVLAPDRNGVVLQRLYYTGRRGTRLAIGLLVSDLDGDVWRGVGEVLAPGEGFDAFGVADPAPVLEGGVLRVHYAGTDGIRWRIGLAGPAGTLGE